MVSSDWLDYARQTTAELIASEGRYRTDSLVCAFERGLLEKQRAAGEGHLTRAERIVLAVEALERDVNNGGYLQFFINCPEHLELAMNGLEEIGCKGAADLTRRALRVVGLSPPFTTSDVEQATIGLSEPQLTQLDACDREYYESAEDIARKLFDFIKRHRNEITLPQ